MATGSNGESVPGSGWTGARCQSEHKEDAYRHNNTTVPVERCWPSRVRDLESRAEDPVSFSVERGRRTRA